jgi:hypothetical protein
MRKAWMTTFTDAEYAAVRELGIAYRAKRSAVGG